MGERTVVGRYYSLDLVLEAGNRVQFLHVGADVCEVRDQDVDPQFRKNSFLPWSGSGPRSGQLKGGVRG